MILFLLAPIFAPAQEVFNLRAQGIFYCTENLKEQKQKKSLFILNNPLFYSIFYWERSHHFFKFLKSEIALKNEREEDETFFFFWRKCQRQQHLETTDDGWRTRGGGRAWTNDSPSAAEGEQKGCRAPREQIFVVYRMTRCWDVMTEYVQALFAWSITRLCNHANHSSYVWKREHIENVSPLCETRQLISHLQGIFCMAYSVWHLFKSIWPI